MKDTFALKNPWRNPEYAFPDEPYIDAPVKSPNFPSPGGRGIYPLETGRNQCFFVRDIPTKN